MSHPRSLTLIMKTNFEKPRNNKGPSIIIQKDHPNENIIKNLNEGVTTIFRDMITNSCFISNIKPKNVKEFLTGEFWINVMQEELPQFRRNKD